jgi:hypothetical protein
MAIDPKIKSQKLERTSFESNEIMSCKKLSAENIFSKIQLPVVKDSIEPNRISKSLNSLTMGSAVKAMLVFTGTVGSYYLAKTAGIFSYFGWGAKNVNSKDIGDKELVNAKKTLSVETNLEKARQANNPFLNQITQTYKNKDSRVKFEEMKVREFKNLEVEKEDVKKRRSASRRSISVRNSIPDQNIIVGKLFELTIEGTNVFNSSTVFLNAINIPSWLNSSNPTPTLKGSFDTLGWAYGLALSGNYGYVACSSSGLQIIDITDPSNPTFKGSHDTPHSAQKVVLSGNYAYVADGVAGLQIIDVTDPSNPIFKGSYDTPDLAYDVALSENYAYVAAGGSGLQIIDVTDPSNSTFKGSYDTPDLAYDVALSGNYAYVAARTSGLQIIDVTDPSNSTFKGSYTPVTSRGVTLSENYAYVVAGSSGLQIIDITDPSNPTFKGLYNTLQFAYRVALSGNYAYVADNVSGLQIIDITDPENPTFKCSYKTPDEAKDIALSGNYAYVAAQTSGLQIIAPNLDKLTLSGTPNSMGIYEVNIRACNEIMKCTIDSFNITVGNNSPIVSNPLQNQTAIVNALFSYTFSNDTFMDPDSHSLIYTAKLSDNSPLPSWLNFDSPQRKFFGTPTIPTIHPIKVTANDGYNSSVSSNFNILVKNNESPIVTNPLQNQTARINALFNYIFPTDTFFDPDGHSLTYTAQSLNNSSLPSWLNFNSLQRKFFGTPTSYTTNSIEVTANDNYGGNVSNSFNIVVENNVPIVSNPIPDQNVIFGKSFNLTIDGTQVFSSNGALLLKATNIPSWLNSSNPNPTLESSYDTPDLAYEIAVLNNYGYVACTVSGLQIVNITDPSNPIFKGSYDAFYWAYGIALSGNYAYVASGHSGLQVIDISDPANPTFKGSYDTPYIAHGIAVSGDYAYVADGYSGLQIIDISDPANPIFKGSYDTPEYSRGIALSGNCAYVADGESSLQIVDITDLANPTFKGSYDTPGYAREIALFGNYAYVADGASGLQIIDISDPANPTFKGSYYTSDWAYGIALSENYAYVASDYSGLQIIDVTDPSNPIFKGSYDTPDRAYGVTVSGNYVYVTDGESGLQIIASNLDKLILSGTPGSVGTYNIDITACNEIMECVIDSFDIVVENNNAPIVANPLQNQTAIVNALFNYTFSNDTFIDLDGHSLTYTTKLSDDSSLPSWLNFNSSQRKFFGTPKTLTTYSIKVIASDNYGGNVSNVFNIHLINNAPFVLNSLQNQTAIVNALFNYTFSNDTFIDPNGHFLTYTAKLSDDSSLPSWLNFNSSQRKFFGTPKALNTYSIKVIANDNYGESVFTMFNLIVKDFFITDDTTDLMTTLAIISSITGAICTVSFFCSLIIGGGVVMLKRHRNKILGNKSNMNAKKQKKKDELQKSGFATPNNGTQVVIENESVVQKEKAKVFEGVNLSERKAPLTLEYKEDIELDVMTESVKDKISVKSKIDKYSLGT